MFKIPNTDAKLSEIYGFLEKNRRFFQLADYSVSQPTLDNVFEEISAEKEKKKKANRARDKKTAEKKDNKDKKDKEGREDKKANKRQEDKQNKEGPKKATKRQEDGPSTSNRNAK